MFVIPDIYTRDLNNDGKIDIISSTDFSNIIWWENKGNDNYSEAIDINGLNNNSFYHLFFADLDNNGGTDIIKVSNAEDNIVWYPNDGLGNFDNAQLVYGESNESQAIYDNVFAADIDNDGDIDIAATSSREDKVVWFENLLPPSDSIDTSIEKRRIYPNPVIADKIYIEQKGNFLPCSYVIYNTLGQIVKNGKWTEAKQVISISGLGNGIYFLRVIDDKDGDIKGMGMRFVKF